jgi:hypothetical protein
MEVGELVFVEPAPNAFVAPVPLRTFHCDVWLPPAASEVAVPIVATVSTTMSDELVVVPLIDALPEVPLVAVQNVGATWFAPVKNTAPPTIEALPPVSVTVI